MILTDRCLKIYPAEVLWYGNCLSNRGHLIEDSAATDDTEIVISYSRPMGQDILLIK